MRIPFPFPSPSLALGQARQLPLSLTLGWSVYLLGASLTLRPALATLLPTVEPGIPATIAMDLVALDPVTSDSVASDPVATDPVAADLVAAETMVPNSTAPDTVTSDLESVSPSSGSLDANLTEPQPTDLSSVPLDPLNSPHPVPWEWVLTTHEEVSAATEQGIRYYRSPALISPDGLYAAYSRIQFQIESELYRSRVSSVLFLENLETGDLRVISGQSPFVQGMLRSPDRRLNPGAITMLMPVSWTEDSSQVLAREFEGWFSSSDLSDYALIWDREENATYTLAPTQAGYTTAVLLGWSQNHPDQILFRAGTIGEEPWPLLAVTLQGETYLATEDQPLVIGQKKPSFWAGPQAHFPNR